MPFTFTQVKSPKGLMIITPYIFNDERGFFAEVYRKDEFVKAGIKEEFTQDNHSRSTKGVIRGLHFQVEPHLQSKLIRCIKGEVFDVAVDLRKKSPTFGEWYGLVLVGRKQKNVLHPQRICAWVLNAI